MQLSAASREQNQHGFGVFAAPETPDSCVSQRVGTFGRCTYKCDWRVADITSFDQPGDQRVQSAVETMPPKVLAELHKDDKALRLDFVHFGRDPGVHVLAALPLLTSLSINNANITFPSAQYSNLQPGLQSLKFSHCRIAGDTACMCSILGYFTSLTSLELSNLCTPHPVQGLHQLAALTNLQTLNLGGTNTEFNESDWLHALTSLTLLTCTQSLASASQLQPYMSRSSGSRCTVVSQPADTTNVEAQHVYVHNSEVVQYSSYFYADEGYSKGACTDSWQGQHTVDAMQKDKLWMAALLHNCWLDTCNSRGTDYDSHISDNQHHRSDTEGDFSTDDE